MGRKRGNTDIFCDSATVNNLTYMQYLNRLTELAISMFEWKNLPASVDARYLELHLFETGCMVYFNDDVLGDLCLDCITMVDLMYMAILFYVERTLDITTIRSY